MCFSLSLSSYQLYDMDNITYDHVNKNQTGKQIKNKLCKTTERNKSCLKSTVKINHAKKIK